MEKTNALRILDAHNIKYEVFEYDDMETDGLKVAALVGQSPDKVFKTLVTIGADKSHYVFMIPVNCSLNLKKAAKAVEVKSIYMITLKELFPLTGYVHGGCSPIGMKKKFVTAVNDTALLFDKICFSAGRKGMQIEVRLNDLKSVLEYEYHDIV